MIEVKNLFFSYEKGRRILDDINFNIENGKLVSVIGPNGSGKTTLVKCINNILTKESGEVFINNENTEKKTKKELAKLIGYVPQITKEFAMGTVLDTVIMGRKPYIAWKLTEEDIDIAIETLAKIGMTSFANRNFSELSGGQKQKILIARALAQNPEIYLFDEPVSFLDIKNQLDVLNISSNLAKNENKTIIMVIHDLNMAYKYSDVIVLLNQGKIMAKGTPQEVLTIENIYKVYGVETEIIDDKFINILK